MLCRNGLLKMSVLCKSIILLVVCSKNVWCDALGDSCFCCMLNVWCGQWCCSCKWTAVVCCRSTRSSAKTSCHDSQQAWCAYPWLDLAGLYLCWPVVQRVFKDYFTLSNTRQFYLSLSGLNSKIINIKPQ